MTIHRFYDKGGVIFIFTPAFFRFKGLVNRLLFRKLSQRNSFRFCEQAPIDPENFWINRSSRYTAVNITPHTAEVRIFRGNLKEARLRKNIEAVIAAIEWANSATDYTAATDEQFIEWIREHQSRFPNLHSYITSHLEGDR